MKRLLQVDLFEMPERALHREAIAPNRSSGLTQKETASELGTTITAAQNAISLPRKMSELEITDPYVLVTYPLNSAKLVRHLHPRYKSEPLPDAAIA